MRRRCNSPDPLIAVSSWLGREIGNARCSGISHKSALCVVYPTTREWLERSNAEYECVAVESHCLARRVVPGLRVKAVAAVFDVVRRRALGPVSDLEQHPWHVANVVALLACG